MCNLPSTAKLLVVTIGMMEHTTYVGGKSCPFWYEMWTETIRIQSKCISWEVTE